MQKLSIRDATLNDLPRIVEIYNEAIPGRLATADLEPISVESRIDWFKAHEPCDRPLWVCLRESKGNLPPMIIGWLSLNSFYGRPAYQATTEVSIYITAHAHGQGVGTFLMERLLEHCQGNSVTTIMGFVFGHNPASLSLLKKFGFERWGFCPQIAELDGIERDLVILGKRI